MPSLISKIKVHPSTATPTDPGPTIDQFDMQPLEAEDEDLFCDNNDFDEFEDDEQE